MLAALIRCGKRVAYDQTQRPSTLGVDKEEGWDGENDLNGSVAEGCVKSLFGRVTDIPEDC